MKKFIWWLKAISVVVVILAVVFGFFYMKWIVYHNRYPQASFWTWFF